MHRIIGCLLWITFAIAHHAHAANLSLAELLKEERQWAGLHTKEVTVGDISWRYSEGGDTSKPVVLLLHGMGGSRDNWNRVARALTPHYRVIIPDLPMHGNTTVPSDYDPQPAVMVDSLGNFMRHLKLKDVNLAGHSLGGGLATYFAAKYFYNVQSLFLVAPAGVYKNINTEIMKNPERLSNLFVQKRGDLKRLMKIAMHQPPFLPHAFLLEQEADMMKNAAQQKKLIESAVKMMKLMKPEGYRLVLRAIEAPTLVLLGREDRIFNPEIGEELAEQLKNEEPVVILDNVGHMPIMEAEQLVIQAYLPFLTKAQTWKSPFKNVMPASNTGAGK